jgi:hypothetical protein
LPPKLLDKDIRREMKNNSEIGGIKRYLLPLKGRMGKVFETMEAIPYYL